MVREVLEIHLLKAAKQAVSLRLQGSYLTTTVTWGLRRTQSEGKLPLIWAAQRLSPCAKAYTLFLKESHLVPIYFDLGHESNKMGYLVSWTNDFRKLSGLYGNKIEAVGLKRGELPIPRELPSLELKTSLICINKGDVTWTSVSIQIVDPKRNWLNRAFEIEQWVE